MKNITVFVLAFFALVFSSQTLQAQSVTKVMALNIPTDMKGAANVKTKTYSKEVDLDGVKGLATLKINPDGKIVAIEIKTAQYTKVNVNSLRSEDVRMCIMGCKYTSDPFCILYCHIWM